MVMAFSACVQNPAVVEVEREERQQHTQLAAQSLDFEVMNNIDPEETNDLVLTLYRNPVSRVRVIDFFVALTGSQQIAQTVLQYADEYNISPTLAFALSWVESRYNPYAVNHNSRSIDRGLFQLNSRSFPELGIEDFFDITTNVVNAMEYLSFCLEEGETEVVALAMYNAGRRGVDTGTPRSTLVYISRILDYHAELEANFSEHMWRLSKRNQELRERSEISYRLVVDEQTLLK